MTIHFIEAEMDSHESPQQLQQEIVAELQKQGEPIRWAVMKVDQSLGKVQVEAVVLAGHQA